MVSMTTDSPTSGRDFGSTPYRWYVLLTLTLVYTLNFIDRALLGVLAQPVLQLQSGATIVAQNTNWTTSADRDAITAGSSQAGAFTLSAGDSALIATLAPGAYTVLVTGTGGASGIALVEVYELP